MTKRYKIDNEFDFLVARAERETDAARAVLEEARNSGDYWKEKGAAKLLAFCESEEKAIRHYAEVKLTMPELGDLIDKRWPHFRVLADDARERFSRLDGANT